VPPHQRQKLLRELNWVPEIFPIGVQSSNPRSQELWPGMVEPKRLSVLKVRVDFGFNFAANGEAALHFGDYAALPRPVKPEAPVLIQHSLIHEWLAGTRSSAG